HYANATISQIQLHTNCGLTLFNQVRTNINTLSLHDALPIYVSPWKKACMYGMMTKKAGETMQSILLVEDDRHIVDNLTEYLEGEGFRVGSASGQAGALERLEQEQFDLILLDISLSDGNGFAVCSAVKALYHLPVIFLTASGDEYSTVTGFEVGADDYIPMPCRPRELLMRIKNVLRRTGSGGGLVRLGRVEVDTVRGTATKDGRDLNLSAL